MSKGLKLVLVIAAALFAIGVVLIGISLVSGGSFTGAIPGLSLNVSHKASDSAASATGSYAISTKDITSVEVNWVSGAVVVLPGTGGQISFEEASRQTLTDNEALCWRIDGKTLVIDFSKGSLLNVSKTLTLYLPEKLREELEISASSADVTVDAVQAESLDIEVTSGEVQVLETVSCRSLEISTTSGDITAAGTFDEADLTSTSGKMSFVSSQTLSGLDLTTTSGNITFAGNFTEGDIETSSGEITLTLTENFRELDAESTSGSLTVNFPESVGFWIDYASASGDIVTDLPLTVKGREMAVGKPGGTLSVETTSGDLILNQTK